MRLSWRPWAAASLMVLLAAGCSSPRQAAPAGSTTPPPATSRDRAATRDDATSRVVVVVEENHAIGQIIGSPQAPFLNRLATQGTLLTSYFAITHPSLPNYIAMVSGDTQQITSDCGGCNLDAPNLADQLQTAGISWKAYMEDLPAPCSRAHTAGAYAKKHDPFMYFTSVRNDPGRCAKVVPLDRLDADLAAGRLPRLVFVTPNLDHDMHGAGEGGDDAALIAAADRWLEGFYGKLAGSPGLAGRHPAGHHLGRGPWSRRRRLLRRPGDRGQRGHHHHRTTGQGRPRRRHLQPLLACCGRSRRCSTCHCWATPATRRPPPSPP